MGKVMLVRKRAGAPGPGRAGALYAMKILSKDQVAARGQVAHTRSERQILVEIRHPYIVRLRCAFQSERKLYLVTDYYAGGALYAHLRRAQALVAPEVCSTAGLAAAVRPGVADAVGDGEGPVEELAAALELFVDDGG